MRPKQLTISGWGPYKEVCQIDFTAFEGKGLFLITGATGAGKTTIFDAVCFALYGDVSGEMREKNTVRSDFADADTKTFVELVMEHGGKTYRICRNPEYERPKKRKNGGSAYTKERENAILYLPDGSVVEGSNEVTRRIQELLVLNLKQFKQISMIAQGEFSRLLTAPSREKIAIFREIFGTGVYESFEAILRQRSRELAAQAAALKSKLEEAVRMLSLPEEEYVQLTETEHLNFEAVAEYLKGLEKEYRKVLQQEGKEYRRIEQEITALAAQISRQEEKNRQILKRKECEERLQTLKEQEPAMRTLEKEWKQAQNAGFLEPAEVKLTALRAQLADKEEQLAGNKSQAKILRQEQKSLQKTFAARERITAALRLWEGCRQLEEMETKQKNLLTRLEKDMENLPAEYLRQEAVCMEKRHAYDEAELTYRRASAGILARLLAAGKPCPVCGSLTHPAPAHAEENVPDETRLKALQREAREADQELQKLHALVVEKSTRYEAEKKRYEELCVQREQEEKKLAAEDSCLEEFKALPIQEAYRKLEAMTGRYRSLQELLEEKVAAAQLLQEEIRKGKEEVADCTAAFRQQLKEYGFSSLPQYEKSRRLPEKQRQMEETLRGYREENKSLKELVKQLRQGKDGQELTELAPLQEQYSRLEEKKQLLFNSQKSHNVCLDAMMRTRCSLKEKLGELEKISEEYGYVKDLDNVAGGMNPKKLVFEQYVLASYFEEILRAANLRLLKMTGGRYEMSRPEQVGDGRSRDNLEIQVLDYYTGKLRSVKTLSGGESFKASLSLALGMSDVIQAFHGGIRVDTLFVDEGFGTLDGESLDQACETLQALVEKDRLVGIISHVPELRERIDSQLIVHKTSSGSTVRIVL